MIRSDLAAAPLVGAADQAEAVERVEVVVLAETLRMAHILIVQDHVLAVANSGMTTMIPVGITAILISFAANPGS